MGSSFSPFGDRDMGCNALTNTLRVLRWLWLSKPMGSHFGVGEFTTHCRTYVSGWIGLGCSLGLDWDFHWGLNDLDFDPWPG